MEAVLAVKSSESVAFRETRSRRGKLKGLHFSFFLHRRDAFHRRSIGYSELEVVAASSERQSEFLCTEACHTPIEDAIFLAGVSVDRHTWKIRDLESTFYAICVIGQFESADV